jgi:methylthioribose-1-phosphate isomerase
MLTSTVSAVSWEGNAAEGHCLLLDQTLLPHEELYRPYTDYVRLAAAIRDLVVRGAPAIGVAASYGVVLAAQQALKMPTGQERMAFFSRALETIALARPTAVNLKWAVERMEKVAGGKDIDPNLVTRLLEEAKTIQAEDIAGNAHMADLGAKLLEKNTTVLTYCNTGDLATGGIGTAFGVVRNGYVTGKVRHVYACETRPVMQGLRLTAWELERNKVPFTLICDNMAASLMRRNEIGAIFLGADRIARNGDVANKVGTYSLAVLAHHHRVPFYVVAPTSTFDLGLLSGEQIPIEQRSKEEILGALGSNRPTFDLPAYNPSFDVTPAALITAIVCEKGVIHGPSLDKLEALK